MVIAVVLAIAAGVLVWVFININTPSVSVVLTTTGMPAGTVIRESQITTKLVAKAVLPPGAITNPAEAIGQALGFTVLADEILRQEHLAVGRGSLVARLIATAPGRVAVDLPVEAASGLSGLVMGDLVDVFGEVSVYYDGGVANSIEKVAAQAVIITAPPAGARDNTAIVIACTVEEEAKIAQVLSQNKKVTLFLLPGLDEEPEDTEGDGDTEEDPEGEGGANVIQDTE